MKCKQLCAAGAWEKLAPAAFGSGQRLAAQRGR